MTKERANRIIEMLKEDMEKKEDEASTQALKESTLKILKNKIQKEHVYCETEDHHKRCFLKNNKYLCPICDKQELDEE